MSKNDTRRRALVALIERRFGGVQSRFGTAIGRQADYVSGLVTGKRNLGERLAAHIEQTLGLEPGELDREPSAPAEPAQTVSKFHLGRTVPILAWENLVRSDHEKKSPMSAQPSRAAIGFAPEPPSAPRGTYALTVRGPAMQPEFREGWLIYVDESGQVKHGDFVVARPQGHTLPILRQLIVDGDTAYLHATSPAYPDSMIPLGDGEIIGRVIYQARQY